MFVDSVKCYSRLTRNDGETIDVGTNDNLDDVFGFKGLSSSFLVTWDRGEVLNDVVDGNGGRESDTCTRGKGAKNEYMRKEE